VSDTHGTFCSLFAGGHDAVNLTVWSATLGARMPMISARFCAWAGLALVGLVTEAQARSKTFENPELGFTIALPADCRHQQGPGTLEAICAPDLDAVKGRLVPAASAIVFEVDGEISPPEAKPFTEADFRMELPQSVCGEGDEAKVRLANVRQTTDARQITYAADVICPALRFLGLPERQAEARTVVAGPRRFRLMARYPSVDVDMAKPLAKAFFDSFQLKAGN
jgi:hypothetical protein